MVLVDSSIWVNEFRGTLRISDFMDADQIAVCPPIVHEILRGARNQRVYQTWRAPMMRASMLDDPTPLELFEDASRLFRTCQDDGVTVNSLGDLLIAVCAIRHDIEVFTLDSDFSQIADVVPLKLFRTL